MAKKNSNIRKNIKNSRLAQNITQEYMANKLCIDPVNYGRIERGQTNITVERLMEIADILNVDFNELIGVRNSKEVIPTKEDGNNLVFEKILAELSEIKAKLSKSDFI